MAILMTRRTLAGSLTAAMVLGRACKAGAQAPFPTRPIQLVVPYAPSGGTDLTAREIADALTRQLGQQVVIVNRPGAATIVGSQIVAEAKPDGYTLLMDSLPLAANPGLYRKLPYNSATAFAPISLVSNAPTVLVANPSLPARTAQELVAYIKANPDTVNYASFGIGSGAHLAAELFQSVTGTRLVHIPYDGGGPATTAVISGEAQLLFSSLLPVLGSVRGGLMRAIALAGDRPSPLLPDVPTFASGGIPYETGTWFGLLAPAGTSAPIVDQLHAAVVKALADPALHGQIQSQGADAVGDTPAEFAAFIRTETARWAGVIAHAGLEKQ